jgi:hypothetical protein
MKLLGSLNWYLSRWLEWLPKRVEGQEAERQPVVGPVPETTAAAQGDGEVGRHMGKTGHGGSSEHTGSWLGCLGDHDGPARHHVTSWVWSVRSRPDVNAGLR